MSSKALNEQKRLSKLRMKWINGEPLDLRVFHQALEEGKLTLPGVNLEGSVPCIYATEEDFKDLGSFLLRAKRLVSLYGGAVVKSPAVYQKRIEKVEETKRKAGGGVKRKASGGVESVLEEWYPLYYSNLPCSALDWTNPQREATKQSVGTKESKFGGELSVESEALGSTLVQGGAKEWYIVRPSERKMLRAFRYGEIMGGKAKSKRVEEGEYRPDASTLKQAGMLIGRARQEVGDTMLISRDAHHWGVNVGENVSEAWTYQDYEWDRASNQCCHCGHTRSKGRRKRCGGGEKW